VRSREDTHSGVSIAIKRSKGTTSETLFAYFAISAGPACGTRSHAYVTIESVSQPVPLCCESRRPVYRDERASPGNHGGAWRSSQIDKNTGPGAVVRPGVSVQDAGIAAEGGPSPRVCSVEKSAEAG